MSFTSVPFLILFPILIVAYSVVSQRVRWFLLLAVSYLFYACLKAPHLLIVLASVSVVSYAAGCQIGRATSPARKKAWLWTGILLNLASLVWLKYLPFFVENLGLLLSSVAPGYYIGTMHPLVSVGVSYFVFQGISYLVDIYLEVLTPEAHWGRFALFLGFFPKLLQGPIERGGNLLPQLRELSPLTRENLRAGVNLFMFGMFKKLVIADRLATFVDPVFSNVRNYEGLTLILTVYLFTFQIYFDFSGYTDMALGAARCFNIRLTQNFNSPYMASSIADFWRRWHISFSSWILDYIFKPLQFSFRDFPKWGTPLALLITFLASGIWHGASWCFIAWGAIHGVFLALSVLLRKRRQKVLKKLKIGTGFAYKTWQVLATFHLVCFTWIFFRSSSISDALYVVRSSISGMSRSFSLMAGDVTTFSTYLLPGKSAKDLAAIAVFVFLAAVLRASDRYSHDNSQPGELTGLSRWPTWAQTVFYAAFLYLIAFSGADAQSFIYQQF